MPVFSFFACNFMAFSDKIKKEVKCMRVFAISDLHLSTVADKPMDIFGPGWEDHFERITKDWRKKVTEDDLVIVAGDISWGMYLEEAKPDLDLIGTLPGKIVLLKGNHDYWWKSITAVRNALPQNMFAVQNDCIRFDNILVCGTRGWTVPETTFKSNEDEKIFKRELIRLELSLKEMQKNRKEDDFVIVMTHYPPFNSKMNSSEVTDLIEKYKPDCVIYGHLHGKNCRVKLDYTLNDVRYLLTSCDQVNCELVEVDLKKGKND